MKSLKCSFRWNDAFVNAYEADGAPLNKELTQEIIRHKVVKKPKFMPKIHQHAFGGGATQTSGRNGAYI